MIRKAFSRIPHPASRITNYVSQRAEMLLFLGLTTVFVGYLTVWLPGPVAGLQLIGVEVGEWVKFLGVGQSRNLFYLPPITLGLIMAVLTAGWPNDRWQTWAMRALAIAVSLLAFPAVEAIRDEPASEWRLRLQLIGLVVVVALIIGAGRKQWQTSFAWLPWLLLIFLGVAGALLPVRTYLWVRPVVSLALGLPVGVGLGVWLNGGGHLLVAAVSLWQLITSNATQSMGEEK
ncbi:MAG TPA: hypothetical protein VF177_02645 [Anaerolineae bacterium]